jgi:superoxide dismutase, Fe-Mn family
MVQISRRDFVQSTLALAVVTQLGRAATAFAESPFILPALPYAASALEPVIDTETMKIHHGKHHQAYIDKLNEQVAKIPQLSNKSLEEILSTVSSYPEAVRNNAGGHYNHSFFWRNLAPVGKGGSPSAELAKQITTDLGGYNKFQEAFSSAALSRFGSGWVWLILTPERKLAIISTPYQDNPLMDAAPIKGQPLIALDVWEHAYYLKYQNKRADYVKGWWGVVNWQEVNNKYQSLLAAKS